MRRGTFLLFVDALLSTVSILLILICLLSVQDLIRQQEAPEEVETKPFLLVEIRAISSGNFRGIFQRDIPIQADVVSDVVPIGNREYIVLFFVELKSNVSNSRVKQVVFCDPKHIWPSKIEIVSVCVHGELGRGTPQGLAHSDPNVAVNLINSAIQSASVLPVRFTVAE